MALVIPGGGSEGVRTPMPRGPHLCREQQVDLLSAGGTVGKEPGIELWGLRDSRVSVPWLSALREVR